MSEVYAVLDTCVLLPAPIYNTLLFIAGHHVYSPLWTDLILEELERNMLDPKNPRMKKTPEQVKRRLETMASAFEPKANLDRYGLEYRALIERMPNNEKDRHVLAAAVISEADFLVTENIKDFNLAGTEYQDMAVVTADEFLCILFSASRFNQVNMISALYNQIQSSKQMTILDGLLDKLAANNCVLEFTQQVRDWHTTMLELPADLVTHVVAGRRIEAQTLLHYGLTD